MLTEEELKNDSWDANKDLKHDGISNGYKRILITGSSNSGKSYSLRFLLPRLFKPTEVYIFSRSILNGDKRTIDLIENCWPGGC